MKGTSDPKTLKLSGQWGSKKNPQGENFEKKFVLSSICQAHKSCTSICGCSPSKKTPEEPQENPDVTLKVVGFKENIGVILVSLIPMVLRVSYWSWFVNPSPGGLDTPHKLLFQGRPQTCELYAKSGQLTILVTATAFTLSFPIS